LHLSRGDKIDHRYRVEAKLGEGSQGVIYRVEDLHFPKRAALKLLTAPKQDEGARQRFLREARLGMEVLHPHLVRVFEVGWWDSRPYFTMELLERVRPLLEVWPRLDWMQFLAIAEQVASVLDHFAGRDLVHRDISPSNILIDPNGSVKVIDLGLVRSAESTITDTGGGVVMGSPGYTAPEIAALARDLGPKSDQWALAAIVYETLTGVPPHYDEDALERTAEDVRALQRLVDAIPVRPPIETNPTVHPTLNATVLKALAFDPKHRFDSSLAFISTLSQSPHTNLQLAYFNSIRTNQ
jgi:serine/threonine-protein kinase